MIEYLKRRPRIINKYLIINADDCGLSSGVNRGIIEAFDAGVVSSTTIMVNLPGFDDAIARLKGHPRLGVGLHFNLTYGYPLSPVSKVPSLIDETGAFSGQVEEWEEAEVQIELTAQWRRLLHAGIKADQLDSHHHMQNYLAVYRPMVTLARRERLMMRRLQTEPAIDIPHPPSADLFINDHYFEGDGLERIMRHLADIKEGISELMCHPGYADEVVCAVSTWTTERERELSVLTNPEVLAAIKRHRIILSHYGELRQWI